VGGSKHFAGGGATSRRRGGPSRAAAAAAADQSRSRVEFAAQRARAYISLVACCSARKMTSQSLHLAWARSRDHVKAAKEDPVTFEMFTV